MSASTRRSTASAAVEEASTTTAPEEPRDDDVLPDSLTDALTQASTATASALQGIGGRYLVEVLIPEFWDPAAGAVFTEEGDQQRFWKLTKRFAEGLAERLGSAQICAIYPDSGVAVMLENQWKDAPFRITSLGDRQPVSEDDEIIILAAPDPQGLASARNITEQHEENKHIIMFNPRLASWDVGVGLNVRRIRQNFLSKFLTTYSLRPIGEMGSVFRQWPHPWKVFIEDKSSPGRYLLAADCESRPAGDALDEIIDKALGKASAAQRGEGEGEGAGLFGGLTQQLGSLAGFMRSLTK
ncbi:hypothetical protein WJX73_005025 [Symbiochloris irregularis]|uniref:DUF1995 domain-containing protein n=1 Tax=Symbiochloris irregularis TaxID=706552 RepID=A0AAW1PLF5_9CHLO